ncbi:MAG TPA: response regulator [Steroidobacteraceae bacterium]|nr:response regulator [Steroidobacteraceae bacterium]
MGAKRALIVDDSKSARLFLARVLEKYDIDVDAADSAEAAIDYLGSNRPDVIFMDHLMPGMDGLQAVQHIKNDPRTATIPIMMYTSQEGELYLGQARALGAVGVLPKQIKPTDVSKVLYQLHLLPDRRSGEQSTFTPLNMRTEADPAAAAGMLSKPLTDSALREHFAELRRALVAGVDTQTERITAEVRALLLESLPPAVTRAPAGAVEPDLPPPPPPPQPRGPWLLGGVALLLALLSSLFWWRSLQLLESLNTRVAQLQVPRIAGLLPAPAPVAPPAASAAPADKPIVVLVPYGGEALGGARLDVLSRLLYRLAAAKAPAQVEVRTYAARFCLMGNPSDGFSMAPEELPFARCDLVGNPSEETLSPLQRTPLALANLIGDVRRSSGGAVSVRVLPGEAGSLAQPYPPVSPELTAGEWNRAAIANNRIEIREH